ncbi:hypothetical protein B7P43_G12996 [Cryptotermes secundus]|uniref:C2H2-type domain-containing protein n=1 Tax=Cryptotermes secundus TaxID=105785 RepID=A0A2J7RMD8_9NEOP|nr:hypothetical protein B7P43_G12996 [Cryptotermes secundus]
MIKSRKMRWAGYVTRKGETRNAYRTLVGKPEGKRPLGRPRRKWVGNIKMDLREIGWDGMDWIDLAQDMDQWRAVVNTNGMMSSTVVDSATAGTGSVIKGAEYSDGEDSSSSSEEVEHHDEEDMAPNSVIETPSYKRPFQDSQSEADQSQVKKRRKQSKPVRLLSLTEPSSDDEPESNNEGKTHNEKSPNPAHGHTDTELEMDLKAEPELELDPESDTLKIYDHSSSSQCPHCPEILNSKEHLKFHTENGHFQTQFQHKVGSDNSHGSKSEIPLNLSHLRTTDSTSHIGFAVRSLISEFRNKTDDLIHGTKPQVVLPQTHDSGSSGSLVDGNISLPGYMPLSPHFLLPLMSQSSGLHSTSSLTQNQGQAPGTTSIRIFNPDAYCELCNKEFCNKYFLKTHKANKHGIYVDGPSTTLGTHNPKTPSLPPGISENIITNKIPGNAQLKSFCDICQKKFCNKYFVRRHKAKIHGIIDESLPASGSTSFLNSSDCLRKQETDERGSTSADEAVEASKVKEEPEQDSEEGRSVGDYPDISSTNCTKNSPTPSQQNSKEIALSSDRLRKLGVINADAFCEICCKEYCNKYFLRTHKMKRHGIYISEGDGKELKTGVSGCTAWTYNRMSPLNLIVGEQDSGDKIRNDFSDIDDSECDICGQRFQSFYQMQVHRAYLHVTGSERTEGQEDPEGPINNNNDGKDAISEDLQKLQTMILQLNNLNVSKVATCTICNKVLENHYCLAAHMMTEHGILIEVISNMIKEELETKSPPEKLQSQPATLVGSEKRISVTPTSSYCEICNKELCNKYFMKTHMQRMHGIEIENGAQIGGVICDICNKELCSKYFLRVHKQNTHGIVEDGAVAHSAKDSVSNIQLQVEGDQALKPSDLSDLSHRYFSHFTEVCSICNRRFRSTKWLKAHLLNDHGENGVEKWKELENQYQLISQQGKHQLQSARSFGTVNNSSSGPGCTYSPTLKIPNNWHSQDQDTGCSRPPALTPQERTGDAGGHQVFASLFGSGDSTVKSYHCSYCPFTTPVLAFLFVHERSHGGLISQPLPDPAKPLQCPVCLQSFLQAEVFQHHILTHQFSGVLNQFLGPASPAQYPPQSGSLQERMKLVERHSPNNEENGDNLKNAEKHSTHPASAPETVSSSSVEAVAISTTPQGLYKCTRCGFSSPYMIIVKKHIRKEHKAESPNFEMRKISEAGESLLELKEAVTDEVKRKLQEAARKSQVPASYAVPQNQLPCLDQFIMQPFLLEEPDGTPSEQLQLHRKFVPSLVFLPVKEKLSEPLTVSFTLTPA